MRTGHRTIWVDPLHQQTKENCCMQRWSVDSKFVDVPCILEGRGSIVLYCIVLVNWSIHSWRLYNMIYFVIFCVTWEAFQDHYLGGGMTILMERWLFVTNLQELLKSLTVQHRELALRENKPAGGLPPCCCYFGKRKSVPLTKAESLWNDNLPLDLEPDLYGPFSSLIKVWESGP